MPALEQLGIDRLTVAERLELLSLIWDSVTEGEAVPTPVPEWRLREIERRVALADDDPSVGIPWEVVRARMLGSP